MRTVPSYFELLNNLLLDYSGQTDINGNPIDVSQGSAAFIDSAVLASALQGIYYRIAASEGWALPSVGQAFREALEEWCAVFGVDRVPGESDSELYVRFLSRVQEPPAGGNESDWAVWGRELVLHHAGWTEVIAAASVKEGVRSPGSVDLYLLSRWSDAPLWEAKVYPAGSVIRREDRLYETTVLVSPDPHNPWTAPSTAIPGEVSGNGFWRLCGGCSSLMAEYAKSVIEEERVLGVWDNQYNPCDISTVDIDVLVDGIDDADVVAGELSGLIESQSIGAPITQAQIIATMVAGGALSVTVNQPASDLPAAPGRKYVPGLITITTGK